MRKQDKNRSREFGIAPLFLVLILAGLFALGFGASYVGQKWKTPEPVFCTADAKQCPDGSYVGRTGPKCEFAPCPNMPTSADTVNRIGASSTLDASSLALSSVEGWKTYRNEQYGFEVKYPPDWVVASKDVTSDYYTPDIPLNLRQHIENITFFNTAEHRQSIWIFASSAREEGGIKSLGGGSCSGGGFHVVECSDRISIYGVSYARITEAGMSTEATYRELYLKVYMQTSKGFLQFGVMTVGSSGNVPESIEETVKVFDQILSTFKFVPSTGSEQGSQ